MNVPDDRDGREPRSQHDLRVVLVDDHRLLSQSLALALRLEGVACALAPLHSREALLRSVLVDPPSLVLLDLDLGDPVGDGSTLVEPFVAAGTRVLVVSASTDEDQVCRAVEAGALGVLAKDVAFEELLDTVLAAARGEQVMRSVDRQRVLDEGRRRRTARRDELAPFRRLSHRESQVLERLSSGLGVAAIAAEWFVSEATVRSQVRAVLTKLGVTSQLEAVAAAHRTGWL